LEFKNPNDYKIAKVLAKEIVKDQKFYETSKPTSLDYLADSYITVEQGKLYEKLKKVLKAPVIDFPPGNEGRWKGIFPLCNPQVFPIHIQEESDQDHVHFWPKNGHDMARNEHQARFVFLVPWRFGLIYSDY
jgi:hypothetical protein